jgi:hypothetical protein
MWALGVLLLLGTVLLIGTFKVQHAAATALNHLQARNALADLFRADASRAVAAPDQLDEWTAGPTCLLLRQAEGGHVVYRWQDGHLERFQQPGGATRQLPVGPAGTTVEFLRPGPDRPPFMLRLHLPRPGGAAAVLEIAAALGGDLR